jgi:hypothetical protein
MGDKFMRMKIRLLVIGLMVVLFGGGLSLAAQAGPPAQGPLPADNAGAVGQDLSTPALIKLALARGEIDEETALLYLAYALGDYEKLPAQFHSNVPWDGTLPLHDLQEAVSTMKDSAKQRSIIGILSGSCSSSSSALPNILNSTNFHIQYDTVGGGLTVNDYRDSLETAWTKEITQFGWAAPPVLAGNPPPGNRYHVRIDNLGGGLYGFVSSGGAHAGSVGDNPNTAWNDVDALASCMSLNRDFSGFPGSAQQALDATTAHEFNHSIQYGYGAAIGANVPDDIFFEGGATWMEDEVFDAANDNYNYLWPTFNQCMGQYTASPYPYWITFRGLTERYGTDTPGGGEQVMQDFWELTSQNAASNLAALNTALVNKGTTLADAFHAYAVAVKFNKTCGGGYSYPYCFEEAANYVAAAGATLVNGNIASVGNSYNGNVADNYTLNWVTLPTGGGPYSVTLQNTSAGGQLRASVVCDSGTTLSVTPLPSVVGSGSSSQLASFNPAGCSSVVAVITNQSQTLDNPGSCAARSYTLTTGASAPAAPVAPTLLTATAVSTSQINLAWQDNSNDETGFKIERSPDGTTGWIEITQVGANVTSYADTNLACDTTYHYQVRAYNGNGDSNYTNVANAKTDACSGVLKTFLPIILKSP